ncbi:MAG: hypothetical protein QOF03_1519, partial [Alphaproteobacteria bacterium]|nr:hypothetical protein [Alphaproteobacteria bacterium]
DTDGGDDAGNHSSDDSRTDKGRQIHEP